MADNDFKKLWLARLCITTCFSKANCHEFLSNACVSHLAPPLLPLQIMLGTLISQDCALGLLLAIMPALAARSASALAVCLALFKELFILLLFCGTAALGSRLLIPACMRLLARLSRHNLELFHLGIVAHCFCVALLSEWLGLSLEVGAFVAGLTLSGGAVHHFSAGCMHCDHCEASACGVVLRPA